MLTKIVIFIKIQITQILNVKIKFNQYFRLNQINYAIKAKIVSTIKIMVFIIKKTVLQDFREQSKKNKLEDQAIIEKILLIINVKSYILKRSP